MARSKMNRLVLTWSHVDNDQVPAICAAFEDAAIKMLNVQTRPIKTSKYPIDKIRQTGGNT